MADHNPKITEEIEEIIHLTQDIIVKLSLDIPLGEDLSFLQQSHFYFEIFKIIFNSDQFIDDAPEDGSANRIQKLLDFLANEVLFVNLEHINGEEISNGNIAHIKNFLQLIWALINVEDGGEGIGKENSTVEMNEVLGTDRENEDEKEQIESELSKEMIDKIDLDIMEYEESIKDKSEDSKKKVKSSNRTNKKVSGDSIRKRKINHVTEPDEVEKKPRKKNKTVDLTKKADNMNFKKKQVAEKTDAHDGNVFIKPKFGKPKQPEAIVATANLKPVILNQIEKNIYNSNKHRYLKKEGGTLRENVPAMISNKTLKGLEEYLDPQPAAINKLKDTLTKHKKEYHKCLTDFVGFLNKNGANHKLKQTNLRETLQKERTIRIFEKKLQDDIQNEEMGNYMRMRDEVARYVKRMYVKKQPSSF